MTHVLLVKESRDNDAAEAFGQFYEPQRSYDINAYQGIRPLDGMYVLFTHLSGLLSQSKLLPLSFAPITIELELVDTYQDPVYSVFDNPILMPTISLPQTHLNIGL